MRRAVGFVVNELRTESRLSGPQRQVAGAPSQFAGMRVHFIGIGGCGMSGLARMLLDCGAIISGSEPNPNPQTFELSTRGAKISRDQIGELLSRDINLVVRSAAVKDDNREFQAARAFGIRTIKYAEMLGEVMGERFGVAVAGTHGKSTTTAMISHALLQCGADPSFVVGGTVPQLGGGSRSAAGAIFVAEACEYDRSFHHLRPKIAIITNIEEDHLDCYKGIDEIVDSFHHFASLVPEDGLIIAGGNDRRVIEALAGIKAPMELVGLEGSREGEAPAEPRRPGITARPEPRPPTHGSNFIWMTQLLGVENGCYRGSVQYDGSLVATLRLRVPGEHNLINATMALAACRACAVDPRAAADAIGGFMGVDRRMSEMGLFNGAMVVDDYGHHPTEIRATLKALRQKYQPKRLLCVFQPHQHSRTRFLLNDFADSFAEADETIVPDIYFVRDSDAERQRVSSADLVERINRNGRRARHLARFDQIVEYLRDEASDGDLIVTMGAGNVWEIGRELVSADT